MVYWKELEQLSELMAVIDLLGWFACGEEESNLTSLANSSRTFHYGGIMNFGCLGEQVVS